MNDKSLYKINLFNHLIGTVIKDMMTGLRYTCYAGEKSSNDRNTLNLVTVDDWICMDKYELFIDEIKKSFLINFNIDLNSMRDVFEKLDLSKSFSTEESRNKSIKFVSFADLHINEIPLNNFMEIVHSLDESNHPDATVKAIFDKYMFPVFFDSFKVNSKDAQKDVGYIIEKEGNGLHKIRHPSFGSNNPFIVDKYNSFKELLLGNKNLIAQIAILSVLDKSSELMIEYKEFNVLGNMNNLNDAWNKLPIMAIQQSEKTDKITKKTRKMKGALK